MSADPSVSNQPSVSTNWYVSMYGIGLSSFDVEHKSSMRVCEKFVFQAIT